MLVQSDYHIHASFHRIPKPGAAIGPPAAEQVAAARAAGSRFVGVVEHCNHAPYHPFRCLEALSAEVHSSRFDRDGVFLGVEADLADDGSDCCGRAGREKLKLDYVIGSGHCSPSVSPDLRAYLETEHRRIVGALERNGNIDIIGHPFGEGIRWEKAGLIPRWSWSLIPEEYIADILRAAENSGKALEVNRGDFTDPVYLDFLKNIRDRHILFSVGSDAHDTAATVRAAERTAALDRLGFAEGFHWRPDR